MKTFLGDFNAKVGRENIFKTTIGDDSVHQHSSDNSIKTVNFATPKNLVVKSTMFPHRNIHTYTWTFLDGRTHNQIDYIWIERRWHSSILDGLSWELTVILIANVRERLGVSKQAAQKLDGEGFNLRNLNELEVSKQYQIEITNRFAALEN
jgi:hypothetical protein